MPLYLIPYLAQISRIGNPVLSPNANSLSGYGFFNVLLPEMLRIGLVIAGTIFVFIFVIGAFQWITAGGNKQNLEDARRKITNAIVGLVVLLLMFLITQFVNAILGINIGGLGTPVGPQPTDIPARPAWCLSSSVSSQVLMPGQTITMTITAQPGTVATDYSLAFYNLDNLYPPPNNTPMPIIFGGNQYIRHCLVGVNDPTCQINGQSATFTISYNGLKNPDENWLNQNPRHVQINGYFSDNYGHTSAADVNCVEGPIVLGSSTCIPLNQGGCGLYDPCCAGSFCLANYCICGGVGAFCNASEPCCAGLTCGPANRCQ